MIYSKTITVPSNTPVTSPVETILKVSSGLVWMLEVDYPPGCCGLAHLQIFDGLYQMYPASPGESFACDSFCLHLDDLYFKISAPYEFKIRTWNLDDTWNHNLNIRLGMAMTKSEMSRYMPGLAFEDLSKTIADIVTNQETIKQQQLQSMINNLIIK